MTLTYGSLFTGIGAFDLAFDRAGMHGLWQVEIDNNCNRVLERHYPDRERIRDVTTARELIPVDVICGGWPCQDLSVAGLRKGLAGERSGLWSEFLRIIGEITPRWVVAENVPGLISSWSPVEAPPSALGIRQWEVEEASDFETVISGLLELGYCVAWRVLDAQYDGLAQRRERVFIVASLGTGSCAEVLFDSESVCWNPAPSREAGQKVARTLANGSVSSGYRFDPNGEEYISGTLSPEAHPGGFNGRDAESGILITPALSSEGADASEDGTGRGTPLIASPITASFSKHHGRSAGKDSYPHNLITAPLTSKQYADNESQESKLIAFSAKDDGRDISGIAPTLRAMSHNQSRPNGGGQIGISSPSGVRRLTPLECERLMGLPDNWTKWDAQGNQISDSARYRMIGNSLAVPIAVWIARRIVKITS